MNGTERIAGDMDEFLFFFLEKNAEAGMRGTNLAIDGKSQLLRMLMLSHKWILYVILHRAPVSPRNTAVLHLYSANTQAEIHGPGRISIQTIQKSHHLL